MYIYLITVYTLEFIVATKHYCLLLVNTDHKTPSGPHGCHTPGYAVGFSLWTNRRVLFVVLVEEDTGIV